MKKKTIKMKTNDTELPKWFDGVVYKEGDLVTNPFTGDQAILTPNELAIYDFIKGAEYTIAVNYQKTGDFFVEDPAIVKLTNNMRKGLDWFRDANPRAYMILLD